MKYERLEFRQKISELNKGRPNQNRKGIWIDGRVFLSYSEAEQNQEQGSKGLTRTTIRLYVNDPSNLYYREATPEEIIQEEARRKAGGATPTWSVPIQTRSGLPQKVWLKGTVYESISAAAKEVGVSVQAMSKRFKASTPGYYYLNEQNKCFKKDTLGNVIIISDIVLKQFSSNDNNNSI